MKMITRTYNKNTITIEQGKTSPDLLIVKTTKTRNYPRTKRTYEHLVSFEVFSKDEVMSIFNQELEVTSQ